MIRALNILLLVQIFTNPSLLLSGQNISIIDTSDSSKTYAVIIGITKYQNPAIPALQYADRDAHQFAAWLQSKSGGDVPISYIRLLVNEEASIAAIYQALDWLKDVCRSNDKAYIYFAGHGDVETKKEKSTGYLLAYNSPQNNYANNAISIEDFNNTSIALTTKNNTKVIIISDACRSGKLAGDFFKGRQLAASQLRKVLYDQVRIASCEETELAAEGPNWGGGRGVFSYYLLLGLHGLATIQNDSTINLNSVQVFLDSCFKTDRYLIQNKLIQHPVSDGNPNFVLATPEREETILFKDSLQKARASRSVMPLGLSSLKPLARQPVDYFFNRTSSIDIESIISFKEYESLDKSELPLRMVNDCIAYQKRLYAERDGSTNLEIDYEKYEVYKLDTLKMLLDELKNNKSLPNRFIEKFILMVHQKAQEMINAYLKGDVDEMERRQYYYSGKRNYQNFLPMLHLAMKLISPDHQLAHILKVNNFYLTGLIYRMQMATSKNLKGLMLQAFHNQYQALKLEPYAAYILNEIGNLHLSKNNFDSARVCYNLASVVAPTWAIPWSNKIRVGLASNKLNDAVNAIHIADSLQKNLAYIFINAGMAMEKKKNLLAAESYYLRAIKENNVHYLPYEKLGYLYLKTGKYDSANIYLKKAEIRKDAFTINDISFQFGVEAGSLVLPPVELTEKETCLDKLPENEKGILYKKLVLGFRLAADTSKQNAGMDMIREVAKNYESIPLAYHYLGKKYYQEGRWQLAQDAVEKSLLNFLPNDSLRQRISSDLFGRPFAEKDSCIVQSILNYQYDELEDHYLLAALYAKNGESDKAFLQYKIISNIENNRQMVQATFNNYDSIAKSYTGVAPLFREYFTEITERPVIMSGAILAARLKEKLGQYHEAEKILLHQVMLNRKAGFARQSAINERKQGWDLNGTGGNNFYWLNINSYLESEVYNFYERMIRHFPRDAEWYEKEGLFLYQRLQMAFNKIRIRDKISFYKDISKYAYPWRPGNDKNNPYKFVTPGTEDSLTILSTDYDPVTRAIESITLAIKFSGELEPNYEAASALAHLYSWIGEEESAITWFGKSLAIKPDDIILRTEFLNYLTYFGFLPEALEQLQILYENNQASLKQQVQLADWLLLYGQVDNGNSVLQKIKLIDSSAKRAILEIKTREFVLRDNIKSALKIVTDSIAINPISENDDFEEKELKQWVNNWCYYSRARFCAKLGKEKTAYQNLKKVLDGGFRNIYVLKYDPMWSKFRNSSQWNKLISNYSFEEETIYSEIDPIGYRIPTLDLQQKNEEINFRE